jgi:hypothetical protein
MCMGGGSPRRPPKEPEAPVAPTADLSDRETSRQRQRRAAGGTLLTSGQGVQNGAQTQQKTLLGA